MQSANGCSFLYPIEPKCNLLLVYIVRGRGWEGKGVGRDDGEGFFSFLSELIM